MTYSLYLLSLTYSACMWTKGSNRFKISLKKYISTTQLSFIFSLVFLENFSFRCLIFCDYKSSYCRRWHLSQTLKEMKDIRAKVLPGRKNSKCEVLGQKHVLVIVNCSGGSLLPTMWCLPFLLLSTLNPCSYVFHHCLYSGHEYAKDTRLSTTVSAVLTKANA